MARSEGLPWFMLGPKPIRIQRLPDDGQVRRVQPLVWSALLKRGGYKTDLGGYLVVRIGTETVCATRLKEGD